MEQCSSCSEPESLEVEAGEGGPDAGKAGGLGGEGLTVWGRWVASGALVACADEGFLVAGLEGREGMTERIWG